jgi:oligopeptide/dipeptide ABC transporter ATP-binding protein
MAQRRWSAVSTPTAGPDPEPTLPLLELRDIRIEINGGPGLRPVADGVSFKVLPGEILGLVGESGSGKSTLCRLIVGLLHDEMRLASGEVLLSGESISRLAPRRLHSRRPGGVSMVFQDPLTALDPVIRIGEQVLEALYPHRRPAGDQARAKAVQLLERCGLASASRRLGAYPAELSGGERQRVMIAMAIATEPRLLVADEPTSALDVSTQAQILRLLQDLARDFGLAVLLVSHDYSVVQQICSRVAVMYAGRIVEAGATDAVLRAPGHPYTARLIESLPSIRHRYRRLPVIPGRPPSLADALPACPFFPRCSYGSQPACTDEVIPVQSVSDSHWSVCVLSPAELKASEQRVAGRGEVAGSLDAINAGPEGEADGSASDPRGL